MADGRQPIAIKGVWTSGVLSRYQYRFPGQEVVLSCLFAVIQCGGHFIHAVLAWGSVGGGFPRRDAGVCEICWDAQRRSVAGNAARGWAAQLPHSAVWRG